MWSPSYYITVCLLSSSPLFYLLILVFSWSSWVKKLPFLVYTVLQLKLTFTKKQNYPKCQRGIEISFSHETVFLKYKNDMRFYSYECDITNFRDMRHSCCGNKSNDIARKPRNQSGIWWHVQNETQKYMQDLNFANMLVLRSLTTCWCTTSSGVKDSMEGAALVEDLQKRVKSPAAPVC